MFKKILNNYTFGVSSENVAKFEVVEITVIVLKSVVNVE